jgi:rubrerythrin
MSDMFSTLGLQQQISSARQLLDAAKTMEQRAEEKKIKQMGAKAQIESSKILADQQIELKEMREAISALLRHNLEQAEQQLTALQEREKIETERYKENLKFTKIAAWTGIIGGFLGVITIVIQLFH